MLDTNITDNNKYQNTQSEQINPIRLFIGIFLLLFGLVIVCWVFFNIYNIFTNPNKLTLFQNLVSTQLESKLQLKNGEANLTIPPEIIAYVIPIFLLMIASSIGTTLISRGADLLDSNFQKILFKLEIYKIKFAEQLMTLINTVNNKIKELSNK